MTDAEIVGWFEEKYPEEDGWSLRFKMEMWREDKEVVLEAAR